MLYWCPREALPTGRKEKTMRRAAGKETANSVVVVFGLSGTMIPAIRGAWVNQSAHCGAQGPPFKSDSEAEPNYAAIVADIVLVIAGLAILWQHTKGLKYARAGHCR